VWPGCLKGRFIFFWIKFIAVTRRESSEYIARYLAILASYFEVIDSSSTVVGEKFWISFS